MPMPVELNKPPEGTDGEIQALEFGRGVGVNEGDDPVPSGKMSTPQSTPAQRRQPARTSREKAARHAP